MRYCRTLFSRMTAGLWVWYKRFGILLLAGVLASPNAFGQDIVWIGQPSVRDYLEVNVQKAVESYAEMRQHAAQLNAEISEARRAYFNASPDDRDTASDNFGRLLFQKDLMFAFPHLMLSGELGRAFGNVLTLEINGRPLDDGIPPIAKNAFSNWVSGMQFLSGGGFGMAPDPVKVAAVMNNGDAMKEYEIYRRIRDQVEHDDWEMQRTGGARKLAGPGTKYPAFAFLDGTSANSEFHERLIQLEEKIVRCTYVSRQEEGSVFYFWYGAPPKDIARLMLLNPRGFVRLKDHAVDQCPPDDREARAIESSPVKAVMKTPRTPPRR